MFVTLIDPEADVKGWTGAQRHLVAQGMSLEDVYARLLVPLSFEEEDDVFDHTLMLLQIRAALDGGDPAGPPLNCDLYLMSRGDRRGRAVLANGSIENVFQGANPGTGYPGDREIHAGERFTVQVHHVDLHRKDGSEVAADTRVIAVHIPETFRRDGVFQSTD